MTGDERNVDFRNDRFQFQHICTMVERTCCRREHLLHHVALAAGEDEVAVAQLLNMGPQLRLDILLGIFGDLLKLVDSHDARLVCMSKVLENFIQRIFRAVDIAQLHIECRHTRDRVEAEFAADGLDGQNEQAGHLAAAGQKGFVYCTSQQIGKLPQARRVQNVDEERIVFVGDFGFVVAELNQSRLAHTSRRDDYHIVPVGNGFNEPCRFRHAIAEILRLDLPRYDEGIRCLCHAVVVFAKIIIQHKLCK